MRSVSNMARIGRRPILASTIGRTNLTPIAHRTFFWPFRRSPTTPKSAGAAAPAAPLLAQNDLFHPLSQSPFPALVDKANRIKSVSLCPTSLEKHDERTRPAFDCPDCGWPTHASQSRWAEGKEEHHEYCGRLREVNEDEHDIRSGRPMNEFENLPGTSSIPAVSSCEC
jgi:splicing suppressor protein 51